MFNVMEPVCLCLQGHNNPGSRMSTYVDVTNQHATNNTRPSNRKVIYSLTLTSGKKNGEVVAYTGNKMQIIQFEYAWKEYVDSTHFYYSYNM